MNRSCPRFFLMAAVMALASAAVLSSPNYKQVQVQQISYLRYTDGNVHPCVYVSGPGFSESVFLIGSTAADEDRMIRMATAALEKGFQAVVDLQANGSLYYSPFFAVQNIPVPKAGAGTVSSPPAVPGLPSLASEHGTTGKPGGRGETALQTPAADWRAVTVLMVQSMTYPTDGLSHPCLYVIEGGGSSYNIFIVGANETTDTWGFLLGLTALRCGLQAVVDRTSSGFPDVYYTPTVALQNVSAP